MQKILIAALCAIFLVQLSVLAAAEIELNIVSPSDGQSFTTDGSVKFEAKVKNDNSSTDNASSVQISAVTSGFKVTSQKQTINVGETKGITVTINGIVWEKTKVELKVKGNSVTKTDTVYIYLVPPKIGLDIVGPTGTMSLVDVKEGSSTTFDVTVKNTGDIKLQGVTLTVKTRGGIDCFAKTGAKDIAKLTSQKYSVECKNVSSGSSLDLTVKDKNEVASDSKSLTINLVQSFVKNELTILSPTENEELRFGIFGGEINIDVKNTGDAKLEGVCAYLQGVSYDAGGCADLDAGENKTFILNVKPDENASTAYIIVNDSQGLATDKRGVLIRVSEPTLPESNDTAVMDDGENMNENATSLDNKGNKTTSVVAESSNVFGIPTEYIILLVIFVFLMAIGTFIRIKGG